MKLMHYSWSDSRNPPKIPFNIILGNNNIAYKLANPFKTM